MSIMTEQIITIKPITTVPMQVIAPKSSNAAVKRDSTYALKK